LNYVNIIPILSHIASGLYMEKQKYNKVITASLWLLFTVISVAVSLFQNNIQLTFYSMLLAQLIIFFISTKGPAGEKLFLFLTYANSFCISIGARMYVMFFLGKSILFPVAEVVIIALMHLLLTVFLLPNYKKTKIFFQSGWSRINLILIFFFVQFINQYAFSINELSARSTVVDFLIFSVIFYSTLFFIFSAVSTAAEINKKTFENNELRNMAYIDVLTKLQNRTAYAKYIRKLTLERKIKKSVNLISVVMDIDGFKNINDINGHLEGDRILMEVGAFMRQYFDSFKCKVFRIGGDEFVMIAEEAQISVIIEQINAMNKEMLKKIGTNLSYGWAEIDFSISRPFDEAFKKADHMMYNNKQNNKATV